MQAVLRAICNTAWILRYLRFVLVSCAAAAAVCVQVQEAVQQLKLARAPHIVAPICEAGSSSMALRYLDKLTAQQQQQQQKGQRGAWWKQAAAPLAVLKPEFLIFRNITSAVVAQVSTKVQPT
jgi:hypothetical protein